MRPRAYYARWSPGVASTRLASARGASRARAITKRNARMTKYITVLFSLLASGALLAQSQQQIHDQIFGETDAVKKQAEDLNAKVLAPESYAEGMEVYLSAVDTMEKGKDLGRVREELTEAK